jgi:hypothetical protein
MPQKEKKSILLRIHLGRLVLRRDSYDAIAYSIHGSAARR